MIKTKITLSLMYLFCASYILAQNKYIPKIPDSLSLSANAVVLYDKTIVDYNEQGQYTSRYSKAVHVLNNRGQNHLTFRAGYKESSDKISKIKISIYSAEGDLLKQIKGKDIDDYLVGDGYSLASDYRQKYYQYHTQQYPLTIVWTYQKETHSTLMLPSWMPITHYGTAVLASFIEINTAFPLRTKELNLSQFSSIQQQRGKRYEMKNQKAIKYEEYSAYYTGLLPMCLFSPFTFTYENHQGAFSSWQEFGEWTYQTFLTPKEPFDKVQIKGELTNLIAENDSPRTITKKLYRYIQNNTRYVSVTLEDGGLNPMSPQKVHEVKYGDCKALSFYMKSLLEVYDIPANYVVVHAGHDEQVGLYHDYPSVFPGNHVIIEVPIPNDTIWLDCTSRTNPFNFLGKFTDNRLALAVNEEGGRLVQTPNYDSLSFIRDTIDLDIASVQGDNRLLIKTHRNGVHIRKAIGLNELSERKKQQYFEEDYYTALKNLKLEKSTYSIDEESWATHETYQFSLQELAEFSGNYLFVPIESFALPIPKLPQTYRRDGDIVFERLLDVQMQLNIELPVGYQPIEQKNHQLITPYGTYVCNFDLKANILKIEKQIKLNAAIYDPTQYQKLKRFLDEAIKNELATLVLKK